MPHSFLWRESRRVEQGTRVETAKGVIDIVPYEPGLAEKIARLHAIISTPSPQINAAYLDWKYDQNPYLRERHFFVALRGDEVVAMRGFYGTQWEGGGAVHTVPCGGDFIIAPEYRHIGLFSAMARFAEQELTRAGFPLVFSLSAIPVTRLGLLALGWEAVAKLGELYRESSASMALRSAKESLKTTIGEIEGLRRIRRAVGQANGRALGQRRLNLASAFVRFDKAAGETSSSVIVVETTARAREMALLISSLPYDGRLRQRRDTVYFKWRYGNPLSDYRFLYAGEKALEGYLVLGAARYGRRRQVSIVDWEGSTKEVKRQLLERVITLGDFSVIGSCMFGLDTEKRQILSELGFREAAGGGGDRAGMSILAKVLGGAPQEPWHFGRRLVTNPTGWDFRLIYSDCC